MTTDLVCSRSTSAPLTVAKTSAGVLCLGEKTDAALMTLAETTGTADVDLGLSTLNTLANAIPGANEKTINSAFAALGELKLNGALETMLGSQLIALHHLAMDLAAKTARATNTQERLELARTANASFRTFAALAETLDRRRRGPVRQTVTVEHVNINEGGQAVIGAVAPSQGGGCRGCRER